MTTKYLGIPVALLVLLVPAGLAFAEHGDSQGNSRDNSKSIQIHVQGNSKLDVNNNDGESNDGNDGTISATSTIDLQEQGDTNDNEGTSTLSDKSEKEHGEATSTEDRGENKVHGHGVLSSFMNWFLGLPDTTTVGQIRSTIGASTTTASTTVVEQGRMVFFQLLMNFFHLNKDSN
jgi:hypothetical protein